jgi:hypothetical protein
MSKVIVGISVEVRASLIIEREPHESDVALCYRVGDLLDFYSIGELQDALGLDVTVNHRETDVLSVENAL